MIGPRTIGPWVDAIDGRSAISQIIIVNVVVFAANAIFSGRDDSLTNFLSLHAGDLFQPWMWWRLLTYGFAHDPANIFHLFWNMLSLWMLGRAVEDRYGKAEFLRIYLTAIVGAGLVWLIRHSLWKDDASLVLGASGAVTCVVMLFVFLYPKVRFRIECRLRCPPCRGRLGCDLFFPRNPPAMDGATLEPTGDDLPRMVPARCAAS
jgi:membrane associated rhomboid family serine protease